MHLHHLTFEINWVYFSEEEYNKGTSFLFILHLDVDECSSNKDICHSNAECNNTIGSFDCCCLSGYSGNGFNCTGKQNWLKCIGVT